MTETLSYRVLDSSDSIELREYAPHIVAEVSVEATGVRQAAEKGFRPLADYIFGNNLPREKIAMTTPVTSTAEGEKIAMTAPVTSTGATDGLYRVRFSMPKEWTMQTLPKPANPDVELVEIDAQLVLAATFRGRDDVKRVAEAAQRLLDHAAERDMKIDGQPTWAGYSAPYVPVPIRKWEMLLKVSAR
ncbi:MAG: heme-binding protein [Acidimicrobiia bacterium]|nr:heme-binding protein [Acidimicrobiia bacterium]